MTLIERLFEYAPVELQPTELTVDEEVPLFPQIASGIGGLAGLRRSGPCFCGSRDHLVEGLVGVRYVHSQPEAKWCIAGLTRVKDGPLDWRSSRCCRDRSNIHGRPGSALSRSSFLVVPSATTDGGADSGAANSLVV